ncbi:MAG: preprotein translocase subunit SecA [Clostridiaceae bacterium]|nr:preprotein translocase subunit SecA [Clostridiaceae bacterium]
MFERVFGTHSTRELKRITPIVEQTEAFEESIKKLSDSQLKAKTAEFKERLGKGETTDDILSEAFAVVREASRRVLGMRHFTVQLVGGVVLYQGRIAEMKTGEGKTLVATLPAYLVALEGKGVHIVTVNDYLAKRDSEWMGKVYNFLGLSVGLIVHGIDNDERRAANAADITYGTNNEFGFDYLRDNMVIYKEQKVQRGHYFAIVDEVDSILVDEARTPLIISGAGDKSTVLYETANKFARGLKLIRIKESDDKQHEENVEADYIVDEKAKTATLTERGIKKAESFFGLENLSDPENLTISHHINQAIRAHGIMHLDKDYVVKNGEVIIVDEFTGRLMLGRRYSEGLHQAIEAKEKVTVERESKTLATITFQNYFRLYKKLSGMTGTALTEQEEFQEIYKLDVVDIPTNMPLIRVDYPDSVYKNEQGKLNAIIEQIKQCHEKGQPVLVGTITIEKSEELSSALKKKGIAHEVLNAKFHEKEAEIVAQAGKKGAVTIATNMAGRGTDIILGGNAEFLAKREMSKKGFDSHLISEATGYADTDDEEILNARKVFKELYEKYKPAVDAEHNEVIEVGGLFILGTERHESRRIDNQLRGRSGRQGDIGASKFFISLEDDLMRLFGSERLMNIVETLGLEQDQPIEHKMLSNAIENAQKRVEGRNFDIRKHVLQYDDVMNQQRELIYGQRSKVLEGEDLKSYILSMVDSVAERVVSGTVGDSRHPDDYSWETFELLMLDFFGLIIKIEQDKRLEMDADELRQLIIESAYTAYEKKEQDFGENSMRELERVVLLQVVDQKWMDHIDAMDQLRTGIGLRAYAQHDPVIEYKFEGMDMFEEMIAAIKEDTIKHIFHARLNREIKREQVASPLTASHGEQKGEVKRKPVTKGKKVGRNDPCPCGSGKKYKKCCGQ